jgi:hypothetical protein
MAAKEYTMATNKKSTKVRKSGGTASTKGKPMSRRLTTLAGLIEENHGQVLTHLRTTLTFARKTGEYLFEAKEIVIEAGGKWHEWVENHCSFSQSQAQRYIRIFDRYHELLAKVSDPKNLTLVDALRLLSPGLEKKRKGAVLDYRIEVGSKSEYKDQLIEASKIKYGDRSKEGKFLKEKGEALAKQMVALAKQQAAKGSTSSGAIAMALLQRFKKAILDDSLLVKIGEPKVAGVRRVHEEDSAAPRNGVHRQAA